MTALPRSVSTKRAFPAYKDMIIQIAKAKNIVYLVPGDNDLFVLWENGVSVINVIHDHCTAEAQRKRYSEIGR